MLGDHLQEEGGLGGATLVAPAVLAVVLLFVGARTRVARELVRDADRVADAALAVAQPDLGLDRLDRVDRVVVVLEALAHPLTIAGEHERAAGDVGVRVAVGGENEHDYSEEERL